MKIRWHGHACFEITDGITVVTDPHDGKSIGIRPPQTKADLVLVSHDHFDHNCVRAVKGISTEVVEKPGEHSKRGIAVTGIETCHDEEEGAKRGKNNIYKFNVMGIEFCHLGDLGHVLDAETAAKIGSVDILFCPVGDVFTINAEKAKQVVDTLKPKVVIPMHYRVGGLSLSIAPVDSFLDLFPEEKIVKVGNEVGDVSADELPAETEVWLFSL